MILKEGEVIAEHYKLIKHLGNGSFGNVWQAYNMLADINVAIKFYGVLDQKGIDEFRKEFKIAYNLRHPNLLSINHFDVYEKCPYLVMPFCANGSVASRIGKMSESEIWKFVRDVSSGMEFLHSLKAPIIHQDIKPDNILITADGRYVITDFGISRSFRSHISQMSNTGHSSGTIAYMSPERLAAKPLIVLASDIWALGMTLYEIITGEILWEGIAGIRQQQEPETPEIEGDFSKELTDLVKACLEPDTWMRPTAEQIHEYAEAYIHKRPLPKLPNEKEEEKVEISVQQPVQNYNPQPIQNYNSHHLYNPTPDYNQTPNYRSSHTSSYKPTPKPKQQDNNSTQRILTIAGIVVAAIIVLVIAYNAISYFSLREEFIKCTTVEQLEQFINDHPNSSYADKARDKIKGMAPKPHREKQTIQRFSGNNDNENTNRYQLNDEPVNINNTNRVRKPVTNTNIQKKHNEGNNTTYRKGEGKKKKKKDKDVQKELEKLRMQELINTY